jgi:serine O-acetyltransferase
MSLTYLIQDLRAIAGSDRVLRVLKSVVFDHTAHLTIMLRLGQSLLNVPVVGRIFSFLVEYFIRIVFSSDISCRAKIGPGLCIMHGHDIVIGADVVIGKKCKIFNGVTLGNKDLNVSSVDNQPLLGDDVTICTGAKILGPVVLGDSITVGANCVVLKSFPAKSVLVGVPARALVMK